MRGGGGFWLAVWKVWSGTRIVARNGGGERYIGSVGGHITRLVQDRALYHWAMPTLSWILGICEVL
jgi:hypothetical protein